jgi:drug/metabolite transporter (DMT)-like permease
LMIISGILVIVLPSLTQGGFSGNVYGLMKAFVFAAGTISIRRKKEIGLVPTMALAAGLSAVVAAGVAVARDIPLAVDGVSLLILLYLGVVQVGIGFILFVHWSRRSLHTRCSIQNG